MFEIWQSAVKCYFRASNMQWQRYEDKLFHQIGIDALPILTDGVLFF